MGPMEFLLVLCRIPLHSYGVDLLKSDESDVPTFPFFYFCYEAANITKNTSRTALLKGFF